MAVSWSVTDWVNCQVYEYDCRALAGIVTSALYMEPFSPLQLQIMCCNPWTDFSPPSTPDVVEASPTQTVHCYLSVVLRMRSLYHLAGSAPMTLSAASETWSSTPSSLTCNALMLQEELTVAAPSPPLARDNARSKTVPLSVWDTLPHLTANAREQVGLSVAQSQVGKRVMHTH